MNNPLIADMLKHVKLTPAEIDLVTACWTEKILGKGDYLLRNGDICRTDNFVLAGALKAFYINGDTGKEEILYFAIDLWWATDIDSFRKQQSSIYNIQALVTTRLLQINHISFEEMLKQVPALERYFRIILEGYTASLQRRIILNKVYDAEQRYVDFLARYPQLAAQVPLYLIASYLDMSAEFLSRIRKKQDIS
ncbi:Crp/Fnr family transcriptional regulator [Paraflavitalea sp. CAU 1676]|uniref:Crp/Fnr family transcriptional regulator n=1 Tax=Paraflavitalea sp. CAU 1676 TaxID=3032598 RepID=UPI0023DBEC43|nr:Crp/Fnr family transcriptional regulator [Paraflavitalea sp. CAU 1676]MDF2189211.1 Crp/Fnr family transcriptional regulator [Paraflavitalea sp. CAU 1676]